MKITWGNAGALVGYLAVAAALTFAYDIGGEKATLVFLLLAALGITGSALWAYLAARKESGGGESAAASAPAAGAGGTEIDVLVREAESKLAASRATGGGSLSQLPVIFVLGDKGATKTTVIANSGMEQELLAGQVYQQDNMIAPTRSSNFWFARKAVFVEAGGGTWADSGAWARLLQKLAPPKLKSALGGGASASRAVLLCVDIEKFQQAGASNTMQAMARSVQARLNEISTQFGISFPVYVLFTRCDRVGFFHDYVRNLSREESTQVLGVTLPMRSSRSGVYGEEETQRLNGMFDELFYSLADKRVEFLPRENEAAKLPGCYEFPREFRKLRASLVQFLVDIGRPSQLSTSPFLRGFYFTGVRPVVIQDMAPTPAAQPQRPAFEGGGSATKMFNMKELQQQMPMAAPQASGGRKVPQWVFLSHLFNDVLLEDKAALGASEASTKASGMRRVLFGLLGALALCVIVATTVSFFRNRALGHDIIDAAEKIKTVRLAAGAVASVDDLKRLDSLRRQLEKLTVWNAKGAPFSYRWGLYTGEELLPLARKAYYNSFNQLLFSETNQRMLTFMRPLSKPKETDDYNYAYNTLRAHLMTSSDWERSSGQGEDAFLRDTLTARWVERREAEIGDERKALAETQFLFYGGDLKNGNPFSPKNDAAAVDAARRYLALFSGLDRAYNAMLAEADKKNPSVNFNRQYAGSAAVVMNSREVRGAFTKKGWDFMQAAFNDRGKKFGGEEWVLLSSKYKSEAAVPDNLDQMLRDRYTADYIKAWRDYFNITRVVDYTGPADAAAKLLHHSDGRAPILALIGLGSWHTNVETPKDSPYAEKVRKAFEWARVIVAPSEGAYITDKNRPYTTGLSNLQISVDAASKQSPPDQASAQATVMRAQDALGQTRAVAAFPGQDTEGRLDQTLMRILEAPIRSTEGLFSPAKMLNAGGAAMCQQFNVLTNKFPFNPTAQPEVQINELNELLRPGSGKFWQFYEQSLKQFLQKQGTSYVPAGAGATLNPAFVNFFNQVARLSEAFYRGGNDPKLNYTITVNGVDLLLNNTQARSGSISVDGKAARIGGGAVPFTWAGPHTVAFEYNESPAFQQQSLWAIFRFFVDAQVSTQGGVTQLTWPVRGGQGNRPIANARFSVDLQGAPAVFDRDFMRGLRCIATVATK
ncbi:MAG: hypothetical protein JNL62_01715 [Bryobacterales bacterium]|nr:hypothetical protein [Bryobacterales bacterium]